MGAACRLFKLPFLSAVLLLASSYQDSHPQTVEQTSTEQPERND